MLDHAPSRRIGNADIANLACCHEIIEHPHRFLDGRERVFEMLPVEVNIIGAQAAQRLLAGAHDRGAPRPASIGIARPYIAREFSGDYQPVAVVRTAGQRLADNRLDGTQRINVGGVDEIAASIDIKIKHSGGVLRCRPVATDIAKVSVPRHSGLTRSPERPRLR